MTYRFGIIILVGGRSSRFGQDKGLYIWRGKPLVVYMLENLQSLKFPFCLVAADKTQIKTYQKVIPSSLLRTMSLAVNADAPPHSPEIRAPILGAAAGFKTFMGTVDAAFLLSCDIPLINAQILRYMADKYHGQDALVPQWDENSFLEPLHGLYHIETAMKRAELAITNQKWQLLHLIWGSDNWTPISIEKELQPLDPKLASFDNFNYIEDLEKMAARKGGR